MGIGCFAAALAGVMVVAASCSNSSGAPGTGGDAGADATSPGPTEGSERGSCYPNATCNAGLECLSNLCVRGGPSPDDGGAATGDSGPLEAGTDSGSSLSRLQVVCPNGGTTSIQGTVYDPAGVSPLYDVAVYVPNAPAVTLTPGASTASCGTWYTAALVSTVTDAAGHFTLDDMPVGENIPLIVQVGKWRMQYTLSGVAQCVQSDAATLAGAMLRMPKNHTEGDIPNIAVSTGASDSLECLFRRMGIDKGEYTGDPKGAGRIHIFTGGDVAAGQGGAVTSSPASKPSYQALWNVDASMTPYDVVLLSCEGSPTAYLNDAGRTVLSDYTNNGGRVFASHYHDAWFTPTGPFATVSPPLATWNTSTAGFVGSDTASYNGDIVTTLANGVPFPEGVALKSWLGNVGALSDGGLPIFFARNSATVTMTNSNSQPWIVLDPSTPAPGATQYFSFDTPIGVGASNQHGRVVYSDLHLSGGANNAAPGVTPDYPGTTSGGIVPDGCATHALTPQEEALEFMVFDLSSCLTPIGQNPMPPSPTP